MTTGDALTAAVTVIGSGFCVKLLDFLGSRANRQDKANDALIKHLEDDLADLRTRLTALEQDARTLRHERNAAAQQLQAVTFERDELRKQNEELKQTVAELQGQVEGLQGRLAR